MLRLRASRSSRARPCRSLGAGCCRVNAVPSRRRDCAVMCSSTDAAPSASTAGPQQPTSSNAAPLAALDPPTAYTVASVYDGMLHSMSLHYMPCWLLALTIKVPHRRVM